MSEYHVAIRMSRKLTDDEIELLSGALSSPVTELSMEGEDIVMMTLHSEDSRTAPHEAAHIAETATGVEANSTQLLP